MNLGFSKPLNLVSIKPILKFAVCILLTGIFISCKKLGPWEYKAPNKPPTAIAGPDMVITLPTDSISLDGAASNDPDGIISEWLWKKMEGPASFSIVNSNDSVTLVKNLVAGTYLFELSVKDDEGLSAKDTVQIIVDAVPTTNHLPVANAGEDTTIILPANTVNLTGIASTDPDSNIVSYIWTKISGPASFNISNASAVQTQVTNLTEGVYQFELKVTDAGGLYGLDTAQVTVSLLINQSCGPLSPITGTCDNSMRPQVCVRMMPVGTLSKARTDIAVATAGTKVLFAGGMWTLDCPECWGSSRVDIYDTVTRKWSTAELSKGRAGIGTVVAGNKIFFAGGRHGDGAFDQLFSEVDIYNAAANAWSVVRLSQPRAFIAAATAGNKVFFAGGEKDWDYNTSNVVDIYDLTTNTLSTHSLSEARAYVSAVGTNNKVYFAGGHREDRWYNSPSDRIDIYDNVTNTWSTSSLIRPMGSPSGVATNQNIYWASGCDVEIKNINTGISSQANLFSPGGLKSAVIGDKIVYFRGGSCNNGTDKFDVYDITANTWSIGVLPQKVYELSIVAVNNTIYMSGRTTAGCGITNPNDPTAVWKLEF